MTPTLNESDPGLHLAVLLDFASQRYHCLPSEFVRKADTMDLYIMDLACSYQRYQQDLDEAKRSGRPPPPPKMKTSELQALMDRVDGKV